MRVLGVFSTAQLLGGGEVSFSLALKGLKASGCEVLALLPGPGPLAEHLGNSGIRFQFAPQETLRRGGSVQFLMRPHPVWLEIAEAFQPDIIHCNAVRSALYGQAVGRTLAIPVVFHARTPQKDPPFDQFLIATTSAIVCASRVVLERFPAWFGARRRVVIPNPIDPEFLAPAMGPETGLREAWLKDSAGPLVGVIGRLSPAKGQHLIVEAAPAILRDCPSCRFVLIGDEDPSSRDYSLELQSRMDQLGCRAAFVFAGFRKDMRSVYRALDLVAFPTSAEGFGRIVIEAGALAKPVVATDLPVLREIVPAELHNDLLAGPDQLAAKLLHLVADVPFRLETGRQLQTHVASNFSLARHTKELLVLYRKLIAKESKREA